VEDRAVPKLTGYADTTAVGFDNRLRSRQTHSGALAAFALLLTAVELLEDHRLFCRRDRDQLCRSRPRRDHPSGDSPAATGEGNLCLNQHRLLGGDTRRRAVR